MSVFRRCLIALVSVGWIAPLTLAFWSEHSFLYDVIWPWVAWDKHWGGSYHPVSDAPRFFLVSMVWLAVVITWWVWRLTRTDAPR
jgi:hypothetical protein